MKPLPKFSVVIPTLNEAGCIRACIRHVRSLNADAEIVVADGGSDDETVAIAESENVLVCRSRTGRGIQCDAGASVTSGTILLFLHADTFLPANAFELLDGYFQDERVRIGTFRLGFDEQRWLLRVYGFFTRLDSVFTRFGDTCIVVRESFLKEIGGFPDWPLFEDVYLLQTARRKTRVHSFPAKVTTSARRFIRDGVVRLQIRNGASLLRYLTGASPEALAVEYKQYRCREIGPAGDFRVATPPIVKHLTT